jgi:micrococcal nuclease
MYEYKCKIVRVVDGDTIVLDISLGFGLWIHGESIRLFGVDCPECRSQDKEEKAAGIAAKKFVTRRLQPGGTYTLSTQGKGKFGRYLGVISDEAGSVNDALIENHLAVMYYGQNKDEVKAAHLENRSRYKRED